AFWDTETFVLQQLTYTLPDAARDALRWRHSTLDKAKERARQLGLKGAAFPWRSINGDECSAYWPAGTAAFHVNADIADATVRYLNATQDTEFERECGTELLVETARLWASLGHHDPHGGFRIDGVTGPDEYSAVVDNNIYTNLMAQRNLRAAADACERHPDIAEALGVDHVEVTDWREAARKMRMPYDELLRVHPQFERFTEHAAWDFENTPPEKYPLLLNYPYFDRYRKQVIKQADLVLAMHLRGDAFTLEQKRRNFAYYEALTVRDSSLSATTQSVLAAECGHLELAYDYFAETALTDLHDLHRNVRNGLHMAALAGSWISIVAGFGGMRDHPGELSFQPRLPPIPQRRAFRMCFRGSPFCVEIHREFAVYQLVKGSPLTVTHYGQPVTVTEDPVAMPIPPGEELERPSTRRSRADTAAGPRTRRGGVPARSPDRLGGASRITKRAHRPCRFGGVSVASACPRFRVRRRPRKFSTLPASAHSRRSNGFVSGDRKCVGK